MLKDLTRKQKKTLIRIIIGAVFLIALHFTESLPILYQVPICLVPYFIVGYDILWKAVRNIGHGNFFDENFLMVVATIGAFCAGEFHESVGVMLFYQIGEFFQSYAVGKSRRNISELIDIRPDYANIERNGDIVQVDPSLVKVGDVIIVKPGEKIPVDGEIISGASSLNTSALTGESVPRDVEEGDAVISGCINMTGVLNIRTTKLFGESTASKILELVENSGYNKSSSEEFITRFAKIYTPLVCAAALVVAVAPPLVRMLAMGIDPAWSVWIMRALIFLVVSCPCALVISIPLSFFAGIGGASNAGVLVKGASFLESLSKVKSILFDKTGTVTKGVFHVETIHKNTIDKKKLLELAALAEYYSPHPISQCLVTAVDGELDNDRIESSKEVPGYGVVSIVDGKQVAAGNGKLMHKLGVDFMPCHHDGNVVHVAIDGSYCGHIVVQDMIKETSKDAIAKLREIGIDNITILTGDKDETAKNVAAKIGVTQVKSELLPTDKVECVKEALANKAKKSSLVFVGDGINDTPALAASDVGIAMGALGADAAIEAADIVLMDDDPLKVAKAVNISKKCMRIVYENITFAIGIKLLALALSTVGLVNMWMAIFADVGVMIIAVLNAMRALYVKNL